MKKLATWILTIILSIVLIFSANLVYSDTTDDKLQDLNSKIQEYQSKLSELSGQKKTLASTIAYLSTQISLTETEIFKTEHELEILGVEIEDLTSKIENIDYSLDDLTKLFINRVREAYKQQTASYYSLIDSEGFSDLLKRTQYISKVRDHDRAVIVRLEKARLDFDNQKTAKEEKQEEVEVLQSKLEGQKASLASQHQEQQVLLETTKNDEKRYQTLLAEARAELAAIQAIIAGQGDEVEEGPINEGERIASIIVGRSTCSSGTHLHLEVASGGNYSNPFSHLSGKSLIWDNKDPEQNGSGSWNWPLNDPIRITQGYGNTSYSSIYAGGFHTGVDMVNNDNLTVKAVKKGTLYRGAIGCRGGTLRYVKVDHDEDEYSTYYLHVNY